MGRFKHRVDAGSLTLRNVQFLRGVAALLVVGVHLSPLIGFQAPRFGVDLFFVISGFIMATIAPRSPGEFMSRRIARVVPLYWLLTLFTFACALTVPALFKNTEAELGPLVKSLLFVPFAKDGTDIAQPILFVGWTLNYEMAFYALFAAALALGRPVLFSSAAIIGLVGAGIVFQPEAIVPAFYTDPIMLEFAFGMAAAVIYRRYSISPFVLLGVPLLIAGDFLFAEWARPLSLGLPAALVLLAALKWERLNFGGRLGQALGDSSYSLYLTHPFIAAAAVALAPAGYKLPIAAVALVACVIVAMGVYHFVERPLTTSLRGLSGFRWRGRAPLRSRSEI